MSRQLWELLGLKEEKMQTFLPYFKRNSMECKIASKEFNTTGR